MARTLAALIAKARRGRTLVVGSKVYGQEADRRELYEDAVGVDQFEGEGVDLVHDLEKPLLGHGLFDHVDCVSVLEHCRRPWLMAATIESAMAHEATILISVPFVWRLHDYPGDYWRMTHEALEVLFPHVEWSERWFLVADVLRRGVPKLNIRETRWVARAETVAFGVRG